jgi:SAM-dependent methyltransferase
LELRQCIERTKYHQTLASLPDTPVDRALELACAEGHFTLQLAPRVRHLVAVDISPTALDRAKRRCRELPNIEFQTLDLLNEAIPSALDLVVCSEVLYYMPLDRLAEVAGKIAAATKPGGHLLMAHSHAIADDHDRTAFDWGHSFGAKTISETFSGLDQLARSAAHLRPRRGPLS